MQIINIWMILMACVLGFVVLAEVSWWIFLRLFKAFDNYINDYYY
jgi:hypothetical protein